MTERLCKCGCGTVLPPPRRRHRPARFVLGHQRHGQTLTPEQVAALAAARTPETYRKVSEAQRGPRHWGWKGGYKQSRESRSEHEARRRARIAGAAVVEPISRAEIIERDQSTCHLCGGLVSADDIHIDHIVPLSRGGNHSADNVAVAHSMCNMRKGSRLSDVAAFIRVT